MTFDHAFLILLGIAEMIEKHAQHNNLQILSKPERISGVERKIHTDRIGTSYWKEISKPTIRNRDYTVPLFEPWRDTYRKP